MSTSQIWKVFLVDDHQMFLDGLDLLLKLHEHVEVVGTATSADEAIRAIPVYKPDVLITDISMPGKDGVELVAMCKKEFPTMKCVALTMLGDYQTIRSALNAGADAYLLKNSSGDELTKAIRRVANGDIFISSEINAVLAKNVQVTRKTDMLTPRENEVLQLIVQGRSSNEIAEALHLSIDTIKFHRKNILSKLEQPNSVALVRFAIESGLAKISQ